MTVSAELYRALVLLYRDNRDFRDGRMCFLSSLKSLPSLYLT